MPNMVMPLLAAGASSGMVVHLGREETTVVSFLHGRLLRNSIRDMQIGVRHACDRWQELLVKYIAEDARQRLTAEGALAVHVDRSFADRLFFQCAGVDAVAYCELDIVDTDDPDDMDSHWHSAGDEGAVAMHFHANSQQVHITLDGAPALADADAGTVGRFTVPQRLRHECLQCLIDGRDSQDLALEDEHKGVLSLLLASLDRCCHESRAVLLNNLIICGDGALIEGV